MLAYSKRKKRILLILLYVLLCKYSLLLDDYFCDWYSELNSEWDAESNSMLHSITI